MTGDKIFIIHILRSLQNKDQDEEVINSKILQQNKNDLQQRVSGLRLNHIIGLLKTGISQDFVITELKDGLIVEALLGVNSNKRHGLETATREPRTGDKTTDYPSKIGKVTPMSK